jgi:hypothetical protein
MTSSETAITNLVYRYAECIDAGDFDGAAALFTHAQVRTTRGMMESAQLAQLWKDGIIVYDDGTPKTKHVITNAIVEVDDAGGRGTCRSYYTVMQEVPGHALGPIRCGRYHDEFERVDGEWRFSARDYTLHDLPGDLSRHSRRAATGG